jgi:hypothetical protein
MLFKRKRDNESEIMFLLNKIEKLESELERCNNIINSNMPEILHKKDFENRILRMNLNIDGEYEEGVLLGARDGILYCTVKDNKGRHTGHEWKKLSNDWSVIRGPRGQIWVTWSEKKGDYSWK